MAGSFPDLMELPPAPLSEPVWAPQLALPLPALPSEPVWAPLSAFPLPVLPSEPLSALPLPALPSEPVWAPLSALPLPALPSEPVWVPVSACCWAPASVLRTAKRRGKLPMALEPLPERKAFRHSQRADWSAHSTTGIWRHCIFLFPEPLK